MIQPRQFRDLMAGVCAPVTIVTTMTNGVPHGATVSSFASHYGHPNVRYVPITDMPAAETVLVWRRRNPAPAMREFIRVARGSLHDHDARL